ncbi:MAG: FAD-binding dehydrogenase [Marinobacter sp.]|uniref:FAD-binding dehydrogenase n=1 Tax=Marinobacter sp. TaxID=50741 RepID=UPI001B67E02C|nr:FAD-binding dehydrogenase [Marinobacter sp.]MBQ0745181.1 FAD-binding dehydrogenase [Marinobacter sp.]MBQ0814646.1 FAD-binding dehydrogenase [Marinobacter sp.]|tara:strand:+ start:26188 stop:27816 length:1629 start_codon:yes stop_codon:yes gene_type:complete
MHTYKSEVVVIGAGLAGIATALELLDLNVPVVLLDGAPDGKPGGQANEAFGGMLLSNTAEQARNKIKDSPELLLADWHNAACFSDDDHWPKRWAELYVEQNRPMIYDWLKQRGIRFFPSVQWVERGLYGNGNSVPRYHIAWGCGRGVVQTLLRQLESHPNLKQLTFLSGHRVSTLSLNDGKITGCEGIITGNDSEPGSRAFSVSATHTVVCTGGINGNLEKVRQRWDPCYGSAPANLLSGSSPDADGAMHDEVARAGGQVVNLNQMWNYAAGVRHPEPAFPDHGLSLIPPRSALWLDQHGRRIGPRPLITGFDTHDLCKQIGNLPGQISWQVMNYRIAVRELAVSGTDTNPDFRDGKLLRVVWNSLRGGDPALMDWLIEQCPDVVSANTPEELVAKMNQAAGNHDVRAEDMIRDIRTYDNNIARGKKLQNDDQIRRLIQLRNWLPDRFRTCNLQPIIDPAAGPLIAIREQLISRKSMGGMQTDTRSRVLDQAGEALSGLYAAGEATGFGGGGISGIRSLEGTFLSNCILNGRRAAQGIAGKL